MITCSLALVSDGISVDQDSKNVTAFSILEEVSPGALPALLPRASLLFVFDKAEGDPDTGNYMLEIVNGGETIFTREMDIRFEGKSRNRNIVKIVPLAIKNAGVIQFQAKIGGSIVGEYRIKVNAPQPRVEASPR